MKKYTINYNRKVPEFRVHLDYAFNEKIMSSPFEYFRVDLIQFSNGKKDSIFPMFVVSMFISASLLALPCFSLVCTNSEMTRAKFVQPKELECQLSGNYANQLRYYDSTQFQNYGAYDNILYKFEKDGLRDLPFDE